MQAVDVAPTDAQQVLIRMPRRPVTANGKGFTILSKNMRMRLGRGAAMAVSKVPKLQGRKALSVYKFGHTGEQSTRNHRHPAR